MRLSRNNISMIEADVILPREEVFALPERVLQFGTGTLSRGVHGFVIDKANNEGLFNGRIVMINSTPYGDSGAFALQDCVLTHIARGMEGGKMVEEKRINASISRVIYANEQWQEVLACATNPHMQVVIADTTEVRINLDEHDSIHAQPPVSFPCKLLAFLYKRYWHFKGDPTKGMVIVSAELVPEDAIRLEAIILEQSHLHNLDPGFMDWLETSNHFCHSLVDRVIPAIFPEQKKAIENDLGYTDDLMVISENFCSWAIESSSDKVAELLSFSKAGSGVSIMPDIEIFRQLKLRLLNGTHTYTCGLAFLAGIQTVKEAMEEPLLAGYIHQLMLEEIAPAIPYDIEQEHIERFAAQVLDRFRNPHIQHTWLSICQQYSSKMKMRNLEVLLQHYQQTSLVPEHMALGFAAHILFMKTVEEDGRFFGYANRKKYLVQDDNAAVYAGKWESNDTAAVVHSVLCDEKLWEVDLTTLPGFEQSVIYWLDALQTKNVLEVIEEIRLVKQLV